MGRHWYDAGSYERSVTRLVSGRAAFALGADIIAGFPGETEREHTETLAYVQRLPFTYLHVFPFSLRPGTAAERLPDHVDPATVARRARELRELAAQKEASYRAQRSGGEADVIIVRGPEREGLTGDYLTVRMHDEGLPRGSRVRATLALVDGHLIARSLATLPT
jgi:threonylcarbamoyladenosine tRNA methylthiotransferase MtaB